MNEYQKASLVLLSIILGLISGFMSSVFWVGGLLFIGPGIIFGIGVCLMLKYLLKIKFESTQHLIFIAGSTASYFLAFLVCFINAEETDPTLFTLFWAGLIGGVGVCLSFTVFKQRLLDANIILIVVSIFTSFTLLLDIGVASLVILFITWQGAMIGCLAYFTIRKKEKENKIPPSSISLTELI